MSNSELVEERVSRSRECFICGCSEFDVREIVAVGDRQDERLVGQQFDECRNCGERFADVGGGRR